MSYISQICQNSSVAKIGSIESSLVDNEITNASMPSTLKKSKRSKVKKIASMFGSKLTQFFNRDMKVGKYNNLINESSPEPKHRVKPTTTSIKPVPKPRTRQLIKETSIPSSSTTAQANVQVNPPACFVAEDVFANLSVKEKARLYMQFIEENTKPVPGVVAKKQQSSVEELLEEFEFRSVFPTQKTHSATLQRMDSMKKACAARKMAAAADASSSTIKAQEFEDIDGKSLTNDDTIMNQEKTKTLPHKEIKQTAAYNTVFKNEDMKCLFFSWFKEKHENVSNNTDDWDNQSLIDEEEQKLTIGKLFEEAIAKLECSEVEESVKVEEEEAEPISSASASSNEESESGVASLAQISSEESLQPEGQKNKCEIDFEFVKPVEPIHKPKTYKINALEKDNAVEETNQITTSDSNTDIKRMVAKNTDTEPRLSEIDQSLIKRINSPSRIKSLYTLTVYDLTTPTVTPRTSLSLAQAVPLKKDFQSIETTLSAVESPQRVVKKPETVVNNSLLQSSKTTGFGGLSIPIKPESSYSFMTNRKDVACMNEKVRDQDFEATANGMESPQSVVKKPEWGINNSLLQTTTPIKSNNSSAAKQLLFSPINKPNKYRRRSIYESESRRSSLTVIKEDQPFESYQAKKLECKSNKNAEEKMKRKSINKAPANEKSKQFFKLADKKTSQFWIKCGDFSISLDIMYNEPERLRLLYEIFNQTSCETKDLYFGIDDQKFSVHEPAEDVFISKHTPPSKGNSHYWFSTGELTLPFTGKHLATKKIQRILRLIKKTVAETGILRFGVDHVEFSNVPEFWDQTTKFSVESQYDLLVGLQSGHSNGLEGRSKYAWPHQGPVTENVKKVKCTRLSDSPIGKNNYDFSSLDNTEPFTPRTSLAMMSNNDSYWEEYDIEPLDELFETNDCPSESNTINATPNTMTVPEMVSDVQKEKERLISVKEPSSSIPRHSFIPKDALNHLRETTEYVERLNDVVEDIGSIGCSNNHVDFTLDELENYIHYLNRYVEICKNSCCRHKDTLLDARVLSKEAVVV